MARTHHLLVTNRAQSVMKFLSDRAEMSGYDAFGYTGSVIPPANAFNGEYLDRDTGCYMLGNGYRAYSPCLRRFLSPDSLSPFGQGGINVYAYCNGDPVNKTDPTGHFPGIAKLPKINSKINNELIKNSRIADAIFGNDLSSSALKKYGTSEVIIGRTDKTISEWTDMVNKHIDVVRTRLANAPPAETAALNARMYALEGGLEKLKSVPQGRLTIIPLTDAFIYKHTAREIQSSAAVLRSAIPGIGSMTVADVFRLRRISLKSERNLSNNVQIKESIQHIMDNDKLLLQLIRS